MAVGCGEERIAPDTIFLIALPTFQRKINRRYATKRGVYSSGG